MDRSHLAIPVIRFIREVQTVVFIDQSVGEAIHSLKGRQIDERVIYFYVLDRQEHLLGVVSTRKLLLSLEELLIKDIFDPGVLMIFEDQPLGQALESMEEQRLLALPVVDSEKKFKGIVDLAVCLEEIEQDLDFVTTKKRMMLFQLLGFFLENTHKGSLVKRYQLRMPWIAFTVIGGLSCAYISNLYADLLGKALILAMFIPLVLSLAEAVSMQVMTQSLQDGIQRAESNSLDWKKLFSHVSRESLLYFAIAMTCSLVVGLFSLLWEPSGAFSWVISTSIFLSIFVATFIGSSIPMLFQLLRWDPRMGSGPIILMIVDLLTTFLYLALARWWIFS